MTSISLRAFQTISIPRQRLLYFEQISFTDSFIFFIFINSVALCSVKIFIFCFEIVKFNFNTNTVYQLCFTFFDVIGRAIGVRSSIDGVLKALVMFFATSVQGILGFNSRGVCVLPHLRSDAAETAIVTQIFKKRVSNLFTMQLCFKRKYRIPNALLQILLKNKSTYQITIRMLLINTCTLMICFSFLDNKIHENFFQF